MFSRRVNRIGGVYSQLYKTVSGQAKRVLGKQVARPAVKRKIKAITATAANSVKRLKTEAGPKGKRKPRRRKTKKAAKPRKKRKAVKKRARKGRKRTRKGAAKKKKPAVRRRKRVAKRKKPGRRKKVKKQKSIFD